MSILMTVTVTLAATFLISGLAALAWLQRQEDGDGE
ncbi:hypothetical protein PAA8504_02843 [Palleronia abyssalis]|uniref:Uncharacterized protein n=1 Tax=Palleronia abyssalis TaxID=1501240 RepID=A0A2R8BXX8_9RHOB|nr:hypothetical protein PAA8504_02843 [Palleronia abyssalis]